MQLTAKACNLHYKGIWMMTILCCEDTVTKWQLSKKLQYFLSKTVIFFFQMKKYKKRMSAVCCNINACN